MASKSWRRANAHNSRSEQSLQKEKCRLERQFEREISQLRAAQNRFELQYKKNSTTERKTSLVLPPVHEGGDIGADENNNLPKRPRERRMSRSLDCLPPIAVDSMSEGTFKTSTRGRSVSLNNAPGDLALSTCKSDKPFAAKEVPCRRRSYAGMSSTSSTRLQPL